MGSVKVNDLLKIAVKRGASDLHLKVGSVPMLRLRGELKPVPAGIRLTHGDVMARAVSTSASPGPRSGR